MSYSKEVKQFLDYALKSFDLHQVGSTINTPDGLIVVTQECVDALTAIKAQVESSLTVEADKF